MQNHTNEMLSYLKKVVAESQIQVTDEQYRLFGLYYEYLMEYNQKVNLTRIIEPQDVAAKHFWDSISVGKSGDFFNGCSVIDVGTGAGFPGIPLAVMRPDVRVTLVDSLKKRTIFLSEAVALLGLANVAIIHARAEDIGQNPKYRARYDVVLARAVAPLNVLAELCIPLAKTGGVFLAMKGPKAVEEIEFAGKAIQKLGATVSGYESTTLPLVGETRTLIRIKKTSPTPAAYPRKAGTPERQPLL